ncbi:MAG: GNAT family N-acetyltransferase [Alistipes sp.]|nr:GNAT family N-acetyltransferase [Alistipes sp.]
MTLATALPHCRLRALEPSDVELLYLWENDPEVWRVGGTTSPLSYQRIAQFVEEQSYDLYTTKQMRLVIECEGIAVGTLDIFDFDPQHLRFGIGILIYAPEARRKGYARAAIEAVKTYARDTLVLRQIWASVAADNEASIALFEGCRFELCGRRRAWLRRHDGYTDQLEYQFIL